MNHATFLKLITQHAMLQASIIDTVIKSMEGGTPPVAEQEQMLEMLKNAQSFHSKMEDICITFFAQEYPGALSKAITDMALKEEIK